MAKLNSATNLQGQTLTISKQDGVKINDANVIAPDVEATNGIIHVIDTVLMRATAAKYNDPSLWALGGKGQQCGKQSRGPFSHFLLK